MPTYDYRCPEGHEFELFQRMSDEPRAECPECGREAARLLSGGAGFLFKGEGFYITDYRSDDYRKAAKADEKAAANGGSSSEKAADGPSGKGGQSADRGSDRGADKGSDKGPDKGSGKSSGEGAKGSAGKASSGGSGASGTSSSAAG